MSQDEKRDWRRTSFQGINGAPEAAKDDWRLFDAAGKPVARIYRYAFGPNAGRWSWFVLVSPIATPHSSATGTAATGEEAREACEARAPAGLVERASVARFETIRRALA